MNTRRSFQASYIALLTAALLAIGTTTRSADKPTLKDAYKEHFMVGVAVNRTIAMRAAVRADNVSRTMEQVESDFALVREQFNQIVPENDTKTAGDNLRRIVEQAFHVDITDARTRCLRSQRQGERHQERQQQRASRCCP